MKKRLSFLSFWSINDELRLAELQEQMDELRLAGLSGVIFHPRYYPNVPVYMSGEYLAILSELILYAKKTGMAFWIYDENGWPSGTASGEVMRRLPDSVCKAMAWDAEKERIVFSEKSAVSSLDPKAVAAFIDITHEGYRKGLTPEAFAYVTGFFSDEVAFLDGHGLTVLTGGLPWDDRFPARYRAKYGEEIEACLPLLFKDGEDDGEFRVRYWEMLTDTLVSDFYQPIAAWCEAHGKKFTAHLKAEESPYFQLSYSGSAFQVLKRVETPAVDALERFPGNNYYPRIAHSIAMQQGRETVLVEAMGGSGWGVSPQSFTDYVLWLARHGMDTFAFHLNQLKLTTQAVQDWPPSMPSHVTWKSAFPTLLADLQAKAAQLPDLTGEPDVLIIAPTRGIMAGFRPDHAMQMNEHDGSNVPDDAAGKLDMSFLALVEACHAAGLHYELSEERVVEEDGVIEAGVLRIGRRVYKRVLIADGCLWRGPGLEARLVEAGVAVCHGYDWFEALPVRAATAAVEAPTAAAVRQSPWQAQAPARNQLLVELIPAGEGLLAGEVPLASPVPELTLLVLDAVRSVSVNGTPLALAACREGFGAAVPVAAALAAGGAMLRIELRPLVDGEAAPMVYLRGRFAVKSVNPSSLREKDSRQLQLDGPFQLVPMPAAEAIAAADLVASGFPFLQEPVTATKTITLPAASGVVTTRLQLAGVQADAAFVTLNGKELGWCWGASWSVPLPTALEPGDYQLEVALYPSTFNMYGPHHHYEGDRHLISPDQYKGVKNFADRPDAPESTHVEAWHFVKWGVTGDVGLI